MQILESLMSICRFKNDGGIEHPRKMLSSLYRLLSVGLLNFDNGTLSHRNTAVLIVSELDNDDVLSFHHVDDYAVETGRRQYAVADLNIAS